MFDLENIKDPSFLKDLNKKELNQLALEIRQFLIEKVSKTGGHLSSNLGVVELTIAIYYVFGEKNDKVIFDVGHQAYVHKILTGRAKEFDSLRKHDGLSGFINYDESSYDCWESGHSSTSIAAQAGFMIAKKEGEDIGNVISLIGDASIGNGLSFESLNFLSTINSRPIIILNDNNMGISKPIGATAKLFYMMRRSKFYHGFKKTLNFIFPKFITAKFHQIKRGIKATIQHENIFEDLGYDYFGPIDGHDLKEIIKTLERAKSSKTGVVIHAITKKGKGYKPAENDEVGKYHGVGPFNKETGKPLKVWKENEKSYSELVANTLYEMRQKEKFFIITPAMLLGSRLKHLQVDFKDTTFDVGIAEEHAASMAGSLALNNQKVILLFYSTFVQRAYDEILNDIARRNQSVIIGIDRAGLVPEDGSTHQGIYDIAMFNSMPNVLITMGKNMAETKALFNFLLKENVLSVIRYPKINEIYNDEIEIIDSYNWELLKEGNKGVIISYGPDILNILKIVEDNNFDVDVINARFINKIDENLINRIKNRKCVIYEQVIANGGLYDLVAVYNEKNKLNAKLAQIAIDKDSFIKNGSINDLKKDLNIDDLRIIEELKKICA